MKPQIRARRFDRPQDFDDRLRRAVSLAYAADTDPHSRYEARAVHADVTHIFGGRVALQDRNDREVTRSIETAIEFDAQRVVAGDRQPLMGADRQASLREHLRFTHVVLGDGGSDIDDSFGV